MTAAPAATATASAGRLRIKPDGPRTTDAVLADLQQISKTKPGRALFRRLRDSGCTVTIEKPDPPTEPPNAWTQARSLAGVRREIIIAFDPADWPSVCRIDALPSDVVLFGRLEDAVALATGADSPVGAGPAVSPAMDAYLRERGAAHGQRGEPPGRPPP